MITTVRQLVDAFSALPANERREATIEILRRSDVIEFGNLSDECLLETADGLFQQMDADEAEHAQR